MDFFYRCIECGREYPGNQVMYLCPDCSGDSPPGTFLSGLLEVCCSGSVQSPEELYPYPLVKRDTYPVGNTPLARPMRLAETYGLDSLFFKLDNLNPSGSFKDRASQMVAAQALALGESTVVVSSTGNAGSAMACAGAAYGLEVILFVPQSAPKNKLLQSVLYGARVVPIKGTYDQAFSLSISCSREFGGINRNTAYNPMTIEGKKSCSIELYRQFGDNIPDVVYIPVGDGVIYSGIYKGFKDLRDAGFTDRIPKLVCVQSDRSDAISRAWRSGKPDNIEEATTIADSISVASPAGGRYALKGLAESSGWCVVISDEQILAAQLELSRDAGIFAEPAAAAGWAGVLHDAPMLRSEYGPDVNIAVIITGTGFKDMDVFTGRTAIPEAIEPDLDAYERRFLDS